MAGRALDRLVCTIMRIAACGTVNKYLYWHRVDESDAPSESILKSIHINSSACRFQTCQFNQ
jgi:hypothetical protein